MEWKQPMFFFFPFSFFLKSLLPQRARNLKAAKGRWMLLAIILAFRFFYEENNLPDADRKQLLVKRGAEGEKVSCSWFYIFIYMFFLLLLAFPLLFAEARGRAFPSRLLEEFHSETPDVRERNGDLLRSPSVPTPLPPRSLSHLPPRDGNTGWMRKTTRETRGGRTGMTANPVCDSRQGLQTQKFWQMCFTQRQRGLAVERFHAGRKECSTERRDKSESHMVATQWI